MGRIAQMLFDNEMKNYGRPVRVRRYTKEVKMLCSMRLAYHSTSGYNEIRNWFTLPTTRTIRTELEPFSCDPGLLVDALKHIEKEISAGTLEPNCTLMVDEMSIMQKACWDPAKKTIIGYANLPPNKQGHLAYSAAVFFLVGIQTKWRFPVAYYLTEHFKGEDMYPILMELLRATFKHSIYVRALVFDGLPANVSMVSLCGAVIDLNNLRNFF
jgi:DNA transposase THAP9